MYAMITGAAGGLGRVFAAECAGRGYDLFLIDINERGLESVKHGLLRQYDIDIHTKACDLTCEPAVVELIAEAKAKHIRIDMLLNVAGLDHEGGFTERSFEQISGILRVNIEATLRVTYEALTLRRDNSRFNIVFVSSLASMYPMPLKATYAASKRFLLDFSIALGEELRTQNVSVLALCPAGLPTTPETIKAIEAQGFWGVATTNNLEKVAHRTITKALRGKQLYVPGVLNNIFSAAAKILPAHLLARLLYTRWRKAQKQWLAT
jgi:short-subunit dehydrogenase